jgi:hypothetical protein
MNMRIFGVTIGTILLVIAVVIIVRMWGSKIPLVDSIPSG